MYRTLSITRNRLFGALGILLLAAGILFSSVLTGSAVETSGTIDVCVSRYTGNMRVAFNDVCSSGEIAYDVEGTRDYTPGEPGHFPTP